MDRLLEEVDRDDSGLGGVAVGFGRIERALDVGIVQGGQELVFGDARTFIEEHAGDAAGNLRGDGGAAAGRDVAAGIQERLTTAGIRFCGSGDLDHRLLIAEGESRGDDDGEDQHRDARDQHAFAHLRLAALAILNAQRTKVRSCRNGWSGHLRSCCS